MLGRPGSPGCDAGLPLLGGVAAEALFPSVTPVGRRDDITLWADASWLVGHATLPAGEALEENTSRLYRQILDVTGGLRLARVWNYVPAINEPRADGLEYYRAFCRGRAAAFEAAWGAGFESRVPAASAVGRRGADLAVVFAATRHAVHHVENPVQVPAYHYPPEHGPRPPSFARATVVRRADGARDLFISGTAAIRGHATCAIGDTAGQVRCMLDNLVRVSRACATGGDLARGRAVQRWFKVYVRHAADHAAVAARLEAELLDPADRVSYVQADICRRELNVEIEASLLGVPPV